VEILVYLAPAPGLLAFFMVPTNMVSPTMHFCCTYSNVADLLLYLVEVGGRLLRSGVLSVEILVYLAASSRPLGLLHAANKYGLSHNAVLLYLQ
jgi:hypothetical protein